MANKRIPMSAADRAKQFMPFAALKGLPEALAEKERPREPRRELSEDSAARLNEQLCSLQRGRVVTAVYYTGTAYTQLTGTVTRVDRTGHVLELDRTAIPMADLLRLIEP